MSSLVSFGCYEAEPFLKSLLSCGFVCICCYEKSGVNRKLTIACALG